LVISQLDEWKYIEESLKAGARGYLTKRAETKEILTAIRTILQGSVYTSKLEVDGSMMPGKLEPVFPPTRNVQSVKFTKRETEVFQLIGAGIRTKDIALQLNLSRKTIETYRENLKHKLSFVNSAELVHFAICCHERQSNSGAGSWSIKRVA
jgi:DNA-binding NarL/FixJ family response regulator